MIAIELEADKTYVVAVSGGVDSVVLLDMLIRSQRPGRLVVAHFDHGMRPESVEEAAFVAALARHHGLKFVAGQGHLPASAGEAEARRLRYAFLEKVRDQNAAAGLVLGHHQDDFLETAIINFHRGSHRRGLVSLKSTAGRLRPLLNLSKQEILAYARRHKLQWREDSSNADTSYLRNYVRWQIMPRLDADGRRRLLEACAVLADANNRLDAFLADYLRHRSYRRQGRVFSRGWFNGLGEAEAREVVASWLIQYRVNDYSRKQIDYIVVKLKTLAKGKTIVVGTGKTIRLTKRCLRLEL